MKAIILGAGRGVRRLDTEESYPSALIEESRGSRVLDWQLAALRNCDITDITFVGGYHIESILERYRHISYCVNKRWAETGPLHSLFLAREEFDGSCIVTHADVVYRDTVARMLVAESAPIAIAIFNPDTEPDLSNRPVIDILRDCIDQRSPIQFAGLLKLSSAGLNDFCAVYDGLLERGEEELIGPNRIPFRIAGIPELLIEIVRQGHSVKLIPISTDWAKMDQPDKLSRFVMSTKAKTLDSLGQVVKTAKILDQVRFTQRQWVEAPDDVYDRIRSKLGDSTLIVRSSALDEDGSLSSYAGVFHSELNVDGKNKADVTKSIEKVIESFDNGSTYNPDHEIFVQQQLRDIAVSGVAFTRDPMTHAPYFVINFDDKTGLTDTVTGGYGTFVKAAYAHHRKLDLLDVPLKPLGPVLIELVSLTGLRRLEIEFAIDTAGSCYLFQARPITTQINDEYLPIDADVEKELEQADYFVTNLMKSDPPSLGKTTLLANMSDWNPAEIIGEHPRPLALSLYRLLVTDYVWSESRARLGYRDQYPFPLIVSVAGKPYIDTRQSFNSFIPADLDDALAEKLVDFYLDELQREPRLQDKVEFEIALTCLDFNFSERAEYLAQNGFSRQEITQLRESLMRVTENIITENTTTFENELGKLETLTDRRLRVEASLSDSYENLCRGLTVILDDCKRFGILPFSTLARYAFVATAMLRSLADRGVFTSDDIDRMMTFIPTVAHSVTDALSDLASGDLDKSSFLAEFGHLRPGTYDILSPSYRDEPALYLDDHEVPSSTYADGIEPSGDFEETFMSRRADIDRLSREAGFDFTAETLMHFVRHSIPAREKAKFEFTKSVDLALRILQRIGNVLDLSSDDLSFTSLDTFLNAKCANSNAILKRQLKRTINFNKKHFQLSKSLHFPNVIRRPEDIYNFTEEVAYPNFITTHKITAPALILKDLSNPSEVTGRIVLIENADPGFDWLFGHGIAGMITKYGGVASHMAVRCAEFGLPAAVGCGDVIYRRISKAKILNLDCSTRCINVVK